MAQERKKVVIIGAGFAGLNAARGLAKLPVEITIIDKKNHHTFQPLLYQVAMAVLSPAEIASPVRAIFSGKDNVRVLLGVVTDCDLQAQTVRIKDSYVTVGYDYLIVAAGATHAYFGHDDWAHYAPGLKTIEDALEIRRRVLSAFESAELMAAAMGTFDPLNFVVIGAGPTGVELAGAISDIARKVMVHDFNFIDPKQARVILLEGGPRVLPSYTEDLSASAEKQLRELGVEVRTNSMVTAVEPRQVKVGDEIIPSRVTLWAAGVKAAPIGKMLAEKSGAKMDRAGRVFVASDLSLEGARHVFVIGDLAAIFDSEGRMVPGVAPAAIQMGKFVARAIQADLEGDRRGVFQYLDKGSLATIGKSKAVGKVRKFHFSGFTAWLAWLGIHILFLIGFRNRFLVMCEWAWAYIRHGSGARLITDSGSQEDTDK